MKLKPLTLDSVTHYSTKGNGRRLMVTIKKYHFIGIESEKNGTHPYAYYHSPHNKGICQACFRTYSELKLCAKNEQIVDLFGKSIQILALGDNPTPENLQTSEHFS